MKSQTVWKIFKATLALGSCVFALNVFGSADVKGPKKELGVASTEMPRELKNVGITENLGKKIDLSLPFTDETGQTVTLGQFYDGKKPVVISLIYYACPGLCNFHLNGAIDALKNVDWSPGKDFQYVVISFDSKENSDLAAKKKETYMKLYDRPGSSIGWHFLTATDETIKKITDAIGFGYKWNEEAEEWAHASAAVITTPDGTISRYLHGIMFDSKTFKLALIEATKGKIGSFVDQMIWYCFQYDPRTSKYTLYAANLMKLGGGLMVLLFAIFYMLTWYRSRNVKV